MSDLERLLEAHVQHELARFQGDRLDALIEQQVRAIFHWFETVKLDDVATRAQIEGVIERYVISLRVSGGITELSGEMSRAVLNSAVSADTRLEQVLSQASYDDFADKVLGLENVRRGLIAIVIESRSFATLSARVVARGVLDLLSPALPNPLSDWASKLLPNLEQRVTETLGRYLVRHRERLARDAERHLLELLDAERLRQLVDEIWDGVSSMRLSDAFAYVGEQDIEDFIVLGYEFWQRYRTSDFFRRISSELVDHFFRKYGRETLFGLIEDMGVTAAMLIDELRALLGPLFEQAARSGFLERQIRTALEDFYHSPAALEALHR
jgi:hypothetical protein